MIGVPAGTVAASKDDCNAEPPQTRIKTSSLLSLFFMALSISLFDCCQFAAMRVAPDIGL